MVYSSSLVLLLGAGLTQALPFGGNLSPVENPQQFPLAQQVCKTAYGSKSVAVATNTRTSTIHGKAPHVITSTETNTLIIPGASTILKGTVTLTEVQTVTGLPRELAKRGLITNVLDTLSDTLSLTSLTLLSQATKNNIPNALFSTLQSLPSANLQLLPRSLLDNSVFTQNIPLQVLRNYAVLKAIPTQLLTNLSFLKALATTVPSTLPAGTTAPQTLLASVTQLVKSFADSLVSKVASITFPAVSIPATSVGFDQTITLSNGIAIPGGSINPTLLNTIPGLPAALLATLRSLPVENLAQLPASLLGNLPALQAIPTTVLRSLALLRTIPTQLLGNLEFLRQLAALIPGNLDPNAPIPTDLLNRILALIQSFNVPISVPATVTGLPTIPSIGLPSLTFPSISVPTLPSINIPNLPTLTITLPTITIDPGAIPTGFLTPGLLQNLPQAVINAIPPDLLARLRALPASTLALIPTDVLTNPALLQLIPVDLLTNPDLLSLIPGNILTNPLLLSLIPRDLLTNPDFLRLLRQIFPQTLPALAAIPPAVLADLTNLIRRFGLPSFSLPTVLPTITLPSLSLPSVTLPSITLPSISVPSISVPSVTLPSLTLPSLTLPSISVPSISVPSISVPSITLPSVTIPSVSVPLPTITGLPITGLTLELLNSLPQALLNAIPANLLATLRALPATVLAAIPANLLDNIAFLNQLRALLVAAILDPLTNNALLLQRIQALVAQFTSGATISLPTVGGNTITLPTVALPTITIPGISIPNVPIPTNALPTTGLNPGILNGLADLLEGVLDPILDPVLTLLQNLPAAVQALIPTNLIGNGDFLALLQAIIPDGTLPGSTLDPDVINALQALIAGALSGGVPTTPGLPTGPLTQAILNGLPANVLDQIPDDLLERLRNTPDAVLALIPTNLLGNPDFVTLLDALLPDDLDPGSAIPPDVLANIQRLVRLFQGVNVGDLPNTVLSLAGLNGLLDNLGPSLVALLSGLPDSILNEIPTNLLNNLSFLQLLQALIPSGLPNGIPANFADTIRALVAGFNGGINPGGGLPSTGLTLETLNGLPAAVLNAIPAGTLATLRNLPADVLALIPTNLLTDPNFITVLTALLPANLPPSATLPSGLVASLVNFLSGVGVSVNLGVNLGAGTCLRSKRSLEEFDVYPIGVNCDLLIKDDKPWTSTKLESYLKTVIDESRTVTVSDLKTVVVTKTVNVVPTPF